MHWATQCNTPPGQYVVQNPTDTGAIESNPAYNPVSNTVFIATYNTPTNFTFSDVQPTPGAAYDSFGAPLLTGGVLPLGTGVNSTIWAVNANNGSALWSYTLPTNVGFRGGIVDSGGVLFVPSIDGNLYMLNDQTGKLITKLLVGEMNVEPSIAQDANGNWKLILPSSSAGTVGGTSIPGNVFALSLPSTSVSSAPPTTVITTTTAPVSGGSTIQITTTQTVSASSTGVSSAAFYGVVVVAVILLITTVLFAMRRRGSPATTSTTSTTTTS